MAGIVFIVQGEGRGHLSQSMALKEMLEARHAFYEESADVRLPTDGLDIEETAREIEALWRG